MNFSELLDRWRAPLAERSAARDKFEAIIYIDGPRTKWHRARKAQHFEEVPGGLRVPHLCTHLCLPRKIEGKFVQEHDYMRLGAVLPDQVLMPEPHADDILQRRRFRSEFLARVWVLTRLKGFDHTKIVGEVRPL